MMKIFMWQVMDEMHPAASSFQHKITGLIFFSLLKSIAFADLTVSTIPVLYYTMAFAKTIQCLLHNIFPCTIFLEFPNSTKKTDKHIQIFYLYKQLWIYLK